MNLKKASLLLALASAVITAGASDVLVNLHSDRPCAFSTSDGQSLAVTEDDWIEKVGSAGGWYWSALALPEGESVTASRSGYRTAWYTYASRPTSSRQEGAELATTLVADRPTLTGAEIYVKAQTNRSGQRRVLYARFSPVEYAVAYDGNGATGGSMGATEHVYDAPAPLAKNAFVREGHAFCGWSRTRDGAVAFADGEDVANLTETDGETVTLYAQWRANAYAVTLDHCDGTNGTTETVSVLFGQKLPAGRSAPLWPGHVFRGYFAQKEAGVCYYDAEMTPVSTWGEAADGTVYAQWGLGSYKITLDDNGGRDGSGSVNATFELAMPPCVAPVREGYAFDGYYDSPSGGVQYYKSTLASARNWDRPRDATLYAHWTPQAYRIELDDNGGAGGSGQVQARFGEPMPTAKAPTRAGYVFLGYYYARETGRCYYRADMASESTWDVSDTATLYAHWQPKVYEVALDANGGRPGATFVQVKYLGELPAGVAAPTRTGYTFAGYADSKRADEGKVYYDADMNGLRSWDRAAEGVTLYARWTAKTYAVTLNGNGGAASVDRVTATYDAVLPTVDAPVWSGHVFAGYFDAAAGGTQYYSPNMSGVRAWQTDGGATLYAHWSAQKIQLTLDDTEGGGGSGRVEAAYGEDLPTVKMPTRTGYDFTGYWTKPSGGDCYYNYDLTPARNWDHTADTTLYAQWTPSSYSVALNANGGEGGAKDLVATYLAPLPEGLEPPCRAGYVFLGYWDDVRNGVQYYAADMTGLRVWNKTSSGVTLHARWASAWYALTLDPNGGVVGQPTVIVPFADDGLPAVTSLPTRVGYVFAGFYDAAEAGLQYYLKSGAPVSGRQWQQPNDGTLYARWAATGGLTVTLNGNGASGGGQTLVSGVVYDAPMPKLDRLPSRTGYSLVGYGDAPAGGTLYYDGEGRSARIWDKPAGGELFAQWKANEYAVRLDQRGGAGAADALTAVFDAALPSGLAAPHREGYAFGGYFDAADGKGNRYYAPDMTPCGVWDKTLETAALYALWTPNAYAVTLDAQGGSGGTESVTVTYGATLPAIVPPVRRGYSYRGYWRYRTGGTQYYDAYGPVGETWQTPSNATLFAHWTANDYVLTLADGLGRETVITNRYDGALPGVAAPTRTGYRFLGYYDEGGRCWYSSAPEPAVATWTETNDVTVTARWEATPCAFAFDDRQGCGGPGEISVAYDAPMPTGLRAPQRRGYVFCGYEDESGELYYDAAMTCLKTGVAVGALRLRARWTANAYTVTLKGGWATDVVLTLTNDVARRLPSPDARTGFSFQGWGLTPISADFAPEAEVLNLTYVANTNVTLFAQWADRREPTVYARILDCEALDISVVTNDPECVNGTNAWSEAEDCVKGGTSLYGVSISAQGWLGNAWTWAEDEYFRQLMPLQVTVPRKGTLSFALKCGPYSKTGKYDANFQTPFSLTAEYPGAPGGAEELTRSPDWNRQTFEITEPGTVKFQLGGYATATLFCQFDDFVWRPDTCDLTVIADNNGVVKTNGTDGVQTGKSTFDYGSVVVLRAVPNDGYEFDHWDGAASGTDAQTSVKLTNDMSVVAHFRLATHPELEATSSGYDPVTLTWGALSWAEAYLVERDGRLIRIVAKDVTSCADESAEQGAAHNYRIGAQLGPDVVWSEVRTVTRGVPALTALQIVGETFDLPQGVSRSFACTATDESGATNVVAATWSIVAGADCATVSTSAGEGLQATVEAGNPQGERRTVTLRAQFDGKAAECTFAVVPVWQVETVALDVDGGEGESSLQARVGQPVGTLPTPTRAHHAFGGWYAPSGDPVTAETLVTPGMELKARWIRDRYTVEVFGNGAATAEGADRYAVTYEWGEAKALKPFVTPATAAFCGWGYGPTQVDFAPDAVLKNLTDVPGGTVRLYAVWESSSAAADWPRILDCEKDAAALRLVSYGSAATTAWLEDDEMYQPGTESTSSLRYAAADDPVSSAVRVTLPAAGRLDYQTYDASGWRSRSVTNRASGALNVLLKADVGLAEEARQYRLDRLSWHPDSCVLAIACEGDGRVTTNGVAVSAVTAVNGATVRLTAVPGEGQEFAGWSGAATAADATLDLTVTGNEKVTAKFRPAGPRIERIEVTDGAAVVYAGADATFACVAYDARGLIGPVTPNRWALSPAGYATVTPEGVVIVDPNLGNVERTLTLTATYVQDGRTLTASAGFKVRPRNLKVTLSFDAFGGTGPAEPVEREYGEVAGTLPTVTWKDHIFRGWYTAKAGGTEILPTTALYRDVTAYARWEIVALESISVAGGASALTAGESASFTCTAAFTDGRSESVTPVWQLAEGAQYAKVDDLGTVTALTVDGERQVTLQANYTWRGTKKVATAALTVRPYAPPPPPDTPRLVALSVIGGENALYPGGEATFSAVATYTNATPSTRTVTPVWTLVRGGEFAEVDANGRVKAGDPNRERWDLTLRAIYAEDGVECMAYADLAILRKQPKVKVTFDAQGGTCAESSRQVEQNAALGALPTAWRDGYDLVGWFTSPATGGSALSATTVVAAELTAYARWVEHVEPVPGPEPEPVETNLTAIAISGGTNVLYAGSNATFACAASYAAGTDTFERPVRPTWTISAGGAYATVDADGTVTALNPGEDDRLVTLKAEYADGGVTKCDTFDIAVLPTPEPPEPPDPPEPDAYELPRGVLLDEPIVIEVESPETVKSVKASKLPSGLKYSWKETSASGAASAVYGTPKKSGIYEATFVVTRLNGKRDAAVTKTFIVRAANETCVRVECDETRGKVSGGGVYAVGKKVTLRATAAKGHAFGGWYLDGALVSTTERLSYVVPAGDVVLRASFLTAAEVLADVVLKVGGVTFTAKSTSAATALRIGESVAWAVELQAPPAASVKMTKLPSGLKYTSKTALVSGTAKKAAATTAKITVTVAKVSLTFTLDVVVEPLPEWVVGSFAGGSTDPLTPGLVTLKISSVGKITGSWIAGGQNWKLSATGFAGADDADGLYWAELTAKSGRVTMTLPLTVDASGRAACPLFEAYWANWKVEPWKSVGKQALKSFKDAFEVPGGTVELTFSTSGAVNMRGMGSAGSASAKTTLCPLDETGRRFAVYVAFPSKSSKAGPVLDFADWVEYELVGTTLRRVGSK